jgi:hypothetical protein
MVRTKNARVKAKRPFNRESITLTTCVKKKKKKNIYAGEKDQNS